MERHERVNLDQVRDRCEGLVCAVINLRAS